jgi:hypothetical protein
MTALKPTLGMQLANTQEMQLICNCCGQPYYPNKGWEDRLQAVFLGTEKFAVCPICTQAPPEDVLKDPKYRRRCVREVQRLQLLYEEAQIQKRGTRT